MFSISGKDEIFALMENYMPFMTNDGDVVFSLTTVDGEAPA